MYLTEEQFLLLVLRALKERKEGKGVVTSRQVTVTAMSPIPSPKRLPKLSRTVLPQSPRSRAAVSATVLPPSPRSGASPVTSLRSSPRSLKASTRSLASLKPSTALPPSPRSVTKNVTFKTSATTLPPSPRSVRLPSANGSLLPPSPVAARSKLPSVSSLTKL